MTRSSGAAATVMTVAGVIALRAGALAGGQPAFSVFTSDQAAAGRAAYQATCASCHLPDLAGRGEAPPLPSGRTRSQWNASRRPEESQFAGIAID
jgi:mono/diheme cytochrome c family protein